MALPGLADILMGLVYYFAALMVTLQIGSWFGARTLAIFAAVHVSLFSNEGRYFYNALEATLLMGLVIYIAAAGAMLSNGTWRVRPWISRMAFLIVVFYGICGLGDLGQMLVQAADSTPYYQEPQYRFTREGQPLMIATKPDLSVEVKDLDGHIITDERYIGRQSYENFLNLAYISSYVGDSHGLDFNRYYRQYRNGYVYAEQIRMNGMYTPPVQWFYLKQQRYFVGFSNQNKRPVEIADRTGFKPWGSVTEPFGPEAKGTSMYGETCLITEGSMVYLFDLPHEKLTPISSPDGGTVSGANILGFVAKGNAYQQRVVLALAHELAVYDLKGNSIATLPYHYDVEKWGAISLAIGQDGAPYFIQYDASIWMGWAKRQKIPSYFEDVDTQGTAVHSYMLPKLPMTWPKKAWLEVFGESVKSPALWYGTMAWEKATDALGFTSPEDRSYDEMYPERKNPKWQGSGLRLFLSCWPRWHSLWRGRAAFPRRWRGFGRSLFLRRT